ncbi:MAG: A24 family peptidase [Gammaproteobacteria bacterium]
MAIFDLLATSPAAFSAVLGVFGLLIGSFLNVVIHRLPIMLDREWRRDCTVLLTPAAVLPVEERYNLATPRSCCPRCGSAIRAIDNVPILSWLALRGRCRHCGAPIAARYPVIEAVAGAMGALIAWRYGYGIAAPLAAVMAWCLLALAVIDYDTMLLPDSLTLPLLWLGLAANLFGVFVPLESAVIGAMAGYLVLWLVYWAFKLATGKEGMGFGDFKLLAAIGAWLGWPVLPSVILGAAGVGAVLGLAMIALRGHERSKPIPFGPYLAAAGFLGLVWGDFVSGLLTRGGGL